MLRPPNHTDATKAKLRALWADPSMSPRDIAAVMGLSRCAVLGLRFRMNLPLRQRSTSKEAVAMRAPSKPAEVPKPKHGCNWPLWGNSRPTHEYCGAAAQAGSVYCQEHLRMARPKESAEPVKIAHEKVSVFEMRRRSAGLT